MGNQLVIFVVPLLAVTQFNASPLEVGTLNLLDSAAALSFGLLIGTTIDRIGGFVAVLAAELLRFLAVALLAVSLILGPSMLSLFVAMFAVGAASLMREAGTSAAIVEFGSRSPAFLNRMNALMRGSSVVSETTGPGVSGILVVVLGSALSLLAGALGFALAGMCALAVLRLRQVRIRARPSRPLVHAGANAAADPGPSEASLSSKVTRERRGMLTGFRFIWSHPVLRPLVLSSVQFNFFTAGLQAVLLYYCVHALGLTVGDLALAGVSAGIGGIVGSVLAASPLVSRRQKSWYLSALTVPAAATAVILAAEGQPDPVALAMVCAAEFVWSAAIVLCVVLFNTLRQVSSPGHVVGQVAASERVLAVGGEVPGALLGGLTGTFVSLQLTMAAAMVGIALSVLWAIRVPDWSSPSADAVGGHL